MISKNSAHKQLDFSEKMKLAASIIESARIEKEREIFELKTKPSSSSPGRGSLILKPVSFTNLLQVSF